VTPSASAGEAEPYATFVKIARCSNVALCLQGDDDTSRPCRKIVQSQGVDSTELFQAPEPWVGEIDVAPILFVASNPSIGDDDHACGSASDDQIWESHHLAFGGGKRTYIIDGIKTTKPDGTPGHTVRYWCAIRARARELITGRPVIPGTDYAITEIVHCKSMREEGVADAADECARKHFDAVMAVSVARVVIALGAFAWRKFLGNAVVPPESPVRRTYGGRERTLVFLPHPSSFIGPKSIAKRYPTDIVSLRLLITP
jgi:hypothetical protein